MERSRLLQCLSADYMRLREVAGSGLTAKVPSCPGWTVADLVRHVGQVYLHKAEVMRIGSWPDPWPPEEVRIESPIALLDRGYGALTHEFSRRGVDSPATTWHRPDQTVKFWMRRMAQETVIHRIDAELAHKIDSAPIPDDLAADGVAEVLELFVGYGSTAWPDDFNQVLADAKGHTIRVDLLSPDATSWLIRADTDRVHVTRSTPDPAPTDPAPAATVAGDPAPLLRWLWARESNSTTDVHSPIEVKGDEEALTELRTLLRAGTQ
ncbi:maleylpyruvate isomerase family mycothiol-dependent enzyme [Dactylosporangium vinaceum]|uniref:Maleylpyruvate isomerase N-terminal domain-containing protein n=1 Tax=Dactylosporangium vinaceum TaxID=53362 RepID=A0ABV5M4M8_9ACTN|nr:maleylpyruvate isomerase family mycothiol-dependent enzyme [Dactylosporangium vinaceum]UAB96128.1 maleylpyruvate isomerase family mycothiol-dependent enzyme [Dactylosporangium vinaceum]